MEERRWVHGLPPLRREGGPVGPSASWPVWPCPPVHRRRPGFVSPARSGVRRIPSPRAYRAPPGVCPRSRFPRRTPPRAFPPALSRPATTEHRRRVHRLPSLRREGRPVGPSTLQPGRTRPPGQRRRPDLPSVGTWAREWTRRIPSRAPPPPPLRAWSGPATMEYRRRVHRPPPLRREGWPVGPLTSRPGQTSPPGRRRRRDLPSAETWAREWARRTALPCRCIPCL